MLKASESIQRSSMLRKAPLPGVTAAPAIRPGRTWLVTLNCVRLIPSAGV